MASFVSSRDLEESRGIKREARRKVLEEEERKFRGKEKAKQRHKDSGNDRWMLPSIEKRIQAETSKISQVKADTNKPKKHKKKKKKKKNHSSSEESDSEKWEEKTENTTSKKESSREEWMNFNFLSDDLTFTSKTIKEKKEKDVNKPSIDEAGQHKKELNPYWKDGGIGLPTANEEKPNKISKDWLLRSLKRMNEQAEEEDRSIESIAAERYGSWTEFQNLLREAEPVEKRRRPNEKSYKKYDDDRNKKDRRYMRPYDDDRLREKSNQYKKPRYHDDDEDRRQHSKSPSKSMFMKPQNDDKHSSRSRHHTSKRPAWKKSSAHHDETEKDETPSEVVRQIDNHNVEKLPSKIDKRVESLVTETNKPPKEPELKKIIPVANVKILTEKEKNQLAAKILKAELMGNEKLAETLNKKLERAREAENNVKPNSTNVKHQTPTGGEDKKVDSNSSDEEAVVLTRTGKDGQTWPLQHSEMAYDSMPNKRKKNKKVPTHKEGERDKYFADDDRYSLQDLVMREKTQEAEDQDAMMSRLASKQFAGTDSDYFNLDDMYVSEAAKLSTRTEEEARQKQRAISDHQRLSKRLEKCTLCFGNPRLCKHLLIAIGKKSYLMLPEHKPLSVGHCLIIPMDHCHTGTTLDEDVWEEMRKFMLSLRNMFQAQEMDCVFMQTCMAFKKSKHFYIDCIPMPTEVGEMAPIYFKKAIQESESEWSHNKKLVDTRNKDSRKCIPKGLPYFAVDFGMDGGFAHVIEDEALFPLYFGREVVGGMLDVEPRLWRHPPKDHFTEQTKRSLQFSEWWKKFDWTLNVTGIS